MRSPKSRQRVARQPQRQRGRLRVAALLQAGAAVFQERGYGAATMAEVASRARSPIGSLYRFFPHKEALADALLSQFGRTLDAALKDVQTRAKAQSPSRLADELVDVWWSLRAERGAIVALLEARGAALALRAQLRSRIRRRIARILMARSPRLPRGRAQTMAAMLLQHFKGIASAYDERPTAGAGVFSEGRVMCRLYLSERL
jgi:AcrR family transcriptional regulator